MFLKDLARGLEVLKFSGNWDADISGISVDSRKTARGDLFCAVRGFKADGREFIKEALNRGAAAVLTDGECGFSIDMPCLTVSDARSALPRLSQRFFNYPSKDLVAVGVTGTNGKTTVSFLIKKILDDAGLTSGLIGTIGYYIGGQKYPAPNTTPEPVDLARMMSIVKGSGGRGVVMEVSSHALDQKRADHIDFDAAVFTNLTRDHLDYHKDLSSYLSAKARLFTILNDSCKKGKRAVLNADDPASGFLSGTVKTEKVTYGIDSGADVRGGRIAFGPSRTEFAVEIFGKRYAARTRLIGRFNVYNALAGIAAGVSLGIAPEKVLASAESFLPPPGRMQFVDYGQGFSVIIDYAHTDDAMRNLLRTVREVVKGKIYLVFGCGGDRDRTKRPLMGAAAEELSDFPVITSDNPRSEEPSAIIADIEKGFTDKAGGRYAVCPDRREAIDQALRMARAGDAVVIAGKGHETYQIVKDRVTHFSDLETVKSFLVKMAVSNN